MRTHSESSPLKILFESWMTQGRFKELLIVPSLVPSALQWSIQKLEVSFFSKRSEQIQQTKQESNFCLMQELEASDKSQLKRK